MKSEKFTHAIKESNDVEVDYIERNKELNFECVR